jgi:hypothetical protein
LVKSQRESRPQRGLTLKKKDLKYLKLITALEDKRRRGWDEFYEPRDVMMRGRSPKETAAGTGAGSSGEASFGG